MIQRQLRRLGSRMSAFAIMLTGATLAASAAAPQLTGFSLEEGAYLFPGGKTNTQCSQIQATYDAKVLSSSWEIWQNGAKVLEGVDGGQAQNEAYSIFDLKNKLIEAMVEQTLQPGEIEFKISKVTYYEGVDEVEASNLGSVKWQLTDMPAIISFTQYWHPDKPLQTFKLNSSHAASADPEYFKLSIGGEVLQRFNQIKKFVYELVQNGEVKYTAPVETKVNYYGRYPAAATLKTTQEMMAVLEPGEVEIRLVEIVYISPIDGTTEKTVRDPWGILAPYRQQGTTYILPGRAITRENVSDTPTLINDANLKEYESVIDSYYPTESEEGIISYVSTRPIADGYEAYLRLGDSNNTFDKRIEKVTLSDDRKTITLDLRGAVNDTRTITNGYKFKDDNGDAYTPELITVYITKLFDTEGRKITSTLTTKNLETGQSASRTWDGELYHYYLFNDITFDTPKLSAAQFYNKENAENKMDYITADTDMMDINVSNSEVIAAADLAYLAGETTLATVASADITRDGDVWNVAVPEAVRSNGMTNLFVTLTNVSYNKVDGNEHVVAPLDLSAVAPLPEVTTIAGLRELGDNTEVVLNTEGVTVTMASPMITTMEDKSSAIQVMADGEEAPLTAGKLLTGKIQGTYLGSGMFLINKEKSDYNESVTDISTGYAITDMADCDRPENIFRLLTFNVEDGISIVKENGLVIVGGKLAVQNAIDALPEDYEYPAEIASVTGVYYVMADAPMPMLIVRSEADIAAPAYKVANNLGELINIEANSEVKVNLKDAKVTYSLGDGQMFMEDATGAIAAVDCPVILAGKAVTGTFWGTYEGANVLALNADKCEYTLADVDVTEGTPISASNIGKAVNDYRLVKLTVSDDCKIENYEDYGFVSIGNVLVQTGYLPEDYVLPAEIESITGILSPLQAGGFAYAIVPRTEADIKAAAPKVAEVNTIADMLALDPETPVKLNLNGAKVTFSMGQAYYVEDTTGGMFVCEGPAIPTGKAVTGTFEGTYHGMATLAVDTEKSVFNHEDVDVSKGTPITIEDTGDDTYRYRLVQFDSTDAAPIKEEASNIFIGESVVVFTEYANLPEDYKFPTTISSVTGILYPMEGMMTDEMGSEGIRHMLLIRSDKDIKAGNPSAITAIEADGRVIGDVYTVTGVKVRNAGDALGQLEDGLYIVNGTKVLIRK